MGEVFLKMAWSVVGGLGIFLLGMKNMSEGMQAIAGDRLRKLISSVTSNRISACGVGTAVTCLVQSSSVTTVMVVGFVSAGFMTLGQAIGVIMGANIGTTITGWILVLKIGKWGLPILGVSAFFFLFSKNERLRYTGMTLMGVGMVFYGLQLMSDGFKPMRTMQEFQDWFARFDARTYFGMLKCVITGCVLTCIVQSSSATLGITMGLASTGMINFQTAAALVLGENIGTTITAFLASIGQPTEARRAAYSHIIFNVVGVLWITAIFYWYTGMVSHVVQATAGMLPDAMVLDAAGEETFPAIRSGIAIVHSGFNVVNTLMFLPMVPLLAKLVTRLVPEKTEAEMPHLTYLDIRMISSPAIGIQQSHDEMIKMGANANTMFGCLRSALTDEKPSDELVRQLFQCEEVMDLTQKEITEFLSHILSGNVSNDVVEAARMQLRIADEYESIGDYATTVLKLHLKKCKNGIWFSDEAWEEILALHDKTYEYLRLVYGGVVEGLPDLINKARPQGDAITHDMKEFRRHHLERMGQEGEVPLGGLLYTDMLNSYRRVKDHALNIAEVIAGEK